MADDMITTVVTKRSDTIERSTIASTPDPDVPNIRVIAMHWARIILYRVLRAGWVSWSGFVTTSYAAKVALPQEIAAVMPTEMADIMLLAARVSVAPMIMSAVTNGTELFAKLDEKYPQLRA